MAFFVSAPAGIEPASVRQRSHMALGGRRLTLPAFDARGPARDPRGLAQTVTCPTLFEKTATISSAMVRLMPISKSAVRVGSISMVMGVSAL